MEHKVVSFGLSEVKAGDGPVTFSGYASTFGNEDKGGDIVMPGAFKDSLDDRNMSVRMLWNHDRFAVPIGKWTGIKEDDKGLFVEGELTPKNSLAEDVGAAMRHGTIDRMSIGYLTLDDSKDDDGRRLLHKLELKEVSPVNFPMNEMAEITSIKSAIEDMETIRDCEHLLRDAVGFSKSEATALVSRLHKICLRDADEELRSEIEQLRERRKVEKATFHAVELIRQFNIRGIAK